MFFKMPWKDKEKAAAYKKAYYERTKEGRYHRIKHNLFKWRKEKAQDYKASTQRTRNKNREQYTKRSKDYWDKHRDELNEKSRLKTELLTDGYMRKHLLKLGYSRMQIKMYPELIETYRLIIKTKRL